MVHDRGNFYFLFWAILCPFTPTAHKIKIQKNPGDIIILPTCTKNYHTFPVKWCTTDAETTWIDRKSDVRRWVPQQKMVTKMKLLFIKCTF